MADLNALNEAANQLIAGLNTPETTDLVIEPTDDGAVENAPVTAEAPAAPTDGLDDLRAEIAVANQRWKTLQGIVEKKDRELETMRQIITTLQTAKPEPVQEKGGVTQEEIDSYGADLLDVVGRKARQELQPIIEAQASLIEELKAQLGGVKQVTAMSALEVFEARLTERVANWRTTNVAPGFMNWLNEADPFSGATKLALIQDAYAKRDLERTARFFEAYAAQTTPPAQETQPKPSDKLAKLVAPGKSKSTPTSGKETKTWSRADIVKLYDDRQRGAITEAEFKAQEQDMFKAQSDGRMA